MSATEKNRFRIAPPGFTRNQWQQFCEDGYVVLENAIEPAAVDTLLLAMETAAAAHPKYLPDQYFGAMGLVEMSRAFVELIDHPRHVGYVYDLYGELLKLHLSEMFIRPPGGKTTEWHPDGARALPYQVFSPQLPLQVRVGYWLTDVETQEHGALMVVPGSHRNKYMDQYTTHEQVPGEKAVLIPAGSITLHHCDLWHRVETNTRSNTRKNLYLSYSPSWITSGDRHRSDPAWLDTLSREQRIIIRDYDKPYQYAKPPEKDFPLFLSRDDGCDRAPGLYRDEVPLHLRHRPATVEAWMGGE